MFWCSRAGSRIRLLKSRTFAVNDGTSAGARQIFMTFLKPRPPVAVRYSFAPIAVLLSTCTWQLRHLKVSIMAIFYLGSNATTRLTVLRLLSYLVFTRFAYASYLPYLYDRTVSTVYRTHFGLCRYLDT